MVQDWEAGKAQPPARVARTLNVIGRMSKNQPPDGIKPLQPEFEVTRDEGPLFKGDKLIKSKKRVLDIAMAGTSATLLARKWQSALLVNVDNETLRRVLDNPEAMAAVERIEGWRTLGDNVLETIINKSEKIKELKKKAKDGGLSEKEKKELTAEEKEFK